MMSVSYAVCVMMLLSWLSFVRKHKHGLIGLVLWMMLLNGCALQPKPVERITPDYPASFLTCVADEWESKTCGPCIDAALMDWMVYSDL
jgi:hypothetical protein